MTVKIPERVWQRIVERLRRLEERLGQLSKESERDA
jgi:hypothetical protein